MYANGYFGYGDTSRDVFDTESMPEYLEGSLARRYVASR
jgi:hypothetical protein